MVSVPHRPIIIGGRNFEICQYFVGAEFFLAFVEDKLRWG